MTHIFSHQTSNNLHLHFTHRQISHHLCPLSPFFAYQDKVSPLWRHFFRVVCVVTWQTRGDSGVAKDPSIPFLFRGIRIPTALSSCQSARMSIHWKSTAARAFVRRVVSSLLLGSIVRCHNFLTRFEFFAIYCVWKRVFLYTVYKEVFVVVWLVNENVVGSLDFKIVIYDILSKKYL